MFIRRNIFFLLIMLFLASIYPSYVYAITCANPGKDGPGGTLSGIINTYYSGTSLSLSAGSTSLTLGSGSGSSTPISSGDLLLIIQMQDASINSSNTTSYGSGTGTSRGYTSLNSAGLYEYVVATNSVSLAGGTLTFSGSGASNGLVNSYTNSDANGTKGQSRYQVIRVPQYSSATLSSGLTSSNWNGSTGGILVFDVSGTLNLNSASINLDGKGFRGAGGVQLSGGTGGSNADLRSLSTSGYHGSKGEGIAGTPRHIYDGTSVVDTGIIGYPNGTFAMGAPGNAGGGGNDGNPTANDQNSGGGGGSNGGQGGRGGNSWASNLAVGGFGGVALPSTTDRIFLGGGGGAGSNNNSTAPASSGGLGGGIVMVRAVTLSGSATISVNGTTPPAPANDGAGGGGAGGTVLFYSSSALSGLTINANGGKGADSWITQAANSTPGERHGPGGGGGGGKRILSSSSGGTVNSGANGVTTTSSSAFGATSGDVGVTLTTLTSTQIPGVNTLASCYASLTVTKSTSTATVTNTTSGTTASYTINVSNASDRGEATSVNISDTLPTGFTYSSVGTITLSGGATRASVSNPNSGDAVPNFGIFTMPAGSTISIPFNVNIASTVTPATYQNPATASYLDPTRTTTSQTTSASYNSASSTNEDVTVQNSTPIVVGPNSAIGTVFNDTNKNGTQETGETGIANVPVTLQNTSNVCVTTTTNSLGQYTFTGLANGNYAVIENGSNLSTCPPVAKPVTNMGGTTPLRNIISINNSIATVNFGNVNLSSLSSFIESCPVDGFISEKLNFTQLNTVNLYNNQKNSLGTTALFEYNAIGFSTVHKYIFGMRVDNTTGTSSELIKIDSNGTAVSLGEISGLPQGFYVAGDYNPFNNRFYVQATNTNIIYAINLDTNTLDTSKNITLPATYSLVDLVFNPTTDTSNGINYIFAMPQTASSNIFKINPSTGAVTTISVSGLPSDTYIAGFADPDNNIYVENTQTNLYKISLNSTQTSGVVSEVIKNNTTINRADGARCPFARVGDNLRFDPNNSGNGNPGKTLYYSHQIFTKISGTVNLSLTTNQNWSYTLFKDVNRNGLLDSGDTQIVNGDIGNVYTEVDSKVYIIVQVFIPSNTPQGTVDVATITATLTPNSTFISISPLSVTDTTTVSQVANILRLIKAVDKTSAKPNENVTYTITYTNSGSNPLNSIKIEDQVPANTTFISAAFSSGSSGSIVAPTVGNTGKITWNVSGSLAPGVSGTVTFVVKINQ